MSYSYDDLRERSNRAVAEALTDARLHYLNGHLDRYQLGYALGQILVARGDFCADAYIAQGARNEIYYLYDRARKGSPA